MPNLHVTNNHLKLKIQLNTLTGVDEFFFFNFHLSRPCHEYTYIFNFHLNTPSLCPLEVHI